MVLEITKKDSLKATIISIFILSDKMMMWFSYGD